jgi:hypothetical protein
MLFVINNYIKYTTKVVFLKRADRALIDCLLSYAEGVKSAVRVKGHTSAKKLLSMSHTSELAKIVREKSHQKGHTMLKWFR